VVGSSGKELGGTDAVDVGAEAPNAAPGSTAVTDAAAVAGEEAGTATAAAAMIVGTVTCGVAEPTGGNAGGKTVLASSALTEALSDLRVGMAGSGSPGAVLSVPAVIGSPVVLALESVGSVNVGVGGSAAVASVPSGAAAGCGLGPGAKRVCALEPPVDPRRGAGVGWEPGVAAGVC
jgi:hypothetical protein